MIKYDTPIEVTKGQYDFMMEKFSGIIVGRFDGEKYLIKVWMMKYVDLIERYLLL